MVLIVADQLEADAVGLAHLGGGGLPEELGGLVLYGQPVDLQADEEAREALRGDVDDRPGEGGVNTRGDAADRAAGDVS